MLLHILNSTVCDILSNSSGAIIPKLTQLSHETIQNVIYDTHLPTIVAQSILTNITTSDDIVTWRNTARELLDVIQSFLTHVCPSVVVLVESTEDVPISLASVLPDKLVLSDDVIVNILIVRYNITENFTDKIENAVINASLMVSTTNSSCAQNQFQSGSVFILNSPVYDVNTILTMVSCSYKQLYKACYSVPQPAINC